LPILASGRNRALATVSASVAVGLVLVMAYAGLKGCAPARVAGDPTLVAGALPSGQVVVLPAPSDSPSPASDSPSPSPSRTTSKTPAKKATGKAAPAHTNVPKPPAPPPAATSTGSCTPTYSGTAAAKATVKSALTDAAGASYKPYIVGVPARTITVPAALIDAVGWQESGWQSNIVSCYHAIGVMQLIQSTADWMNGNFGTDYAVSSVTGNASLGGEYLAWLVYYFGHFDFNDNYDLSTVDPNNPVLLDCVLAAYNLGVGAVDTEAGIQIPNRPYVNAVESDMNAAPWNS
jgi:soluble lytic murein transglycosylase-like protein